MFKKRIIILISVILFLIFVIILSFVTNEKAKENSIVYKLMAYENNVALFENESILTIYDEIVLNSLPKYDREVFEKGLIISDINTLDEILQDFE